MLYCIVVEEQYNLVYFFFKRIESARATPTANLPYGIDHGIPKARHSVSSSSAHHYGSSSHHGDDDEDDGISRAITLSPTSFLNSLSPLNYQRYDIPTSSQQDDDLLFERQTVLLNQTQQMYEEVRGGVMLKMLMMVAVDDDGLKMMMVVVVDDDGLKKMIALGWLLEEIHVSWAQLEKKRTRPRLYTNYPEEIPNSGWR
ncbi:hypothetical protein Tco_0916453 [Tanacetum coccineum]